MLLNSLLLPNKRNPRDGGAGGDLEIAFVNKSRGSKGHKELSLREKQTSVSARKIIEKSQHSSVSQVPQEKRREEGCGCLRDELLRPSQSASPPVYHFA